jgi:predicted lipid-binding transport protein (Tim44 family)
MMEGRKGLPEMANSQYLDILLLAMVAGIILFRLYTVLGRRTGNERPPRETYGLERGQPSPKPGDNVVALPDRSAQRAEAAIEKPSDPVARGLLDIKLADSHFDAADFLAGARQAYEMIVTAFASGDLATLKPLLSADVYAAFEQGVRARQARQEKTDFTFVGFKSAKVADAALKGRNAEIGITFVSQHISVTRNSAGAVVDGDERAVRDVTDHWTFSRDTRSSDPNWTLIGTSGEA